jgi:hypothetical protein
MDTLLEYLPFIVVAIVFYNIGSHVRAFQIMMNLSKDPDRFIEMVGKIKEINTSIEVGMPEDAIEVKTEKVNDFIFAYDKATGEFLAQAQNLHQVMTLAAQRFPGKKFWHPELKEDSQTA